MQKLVRQFHRYSGWRGGAVNRYVDGKAARVDYGEFAIEDIESPSSLPFSDVKNSETYGMLVRSAHEPLLSKFGSKVKVVEREAYLKRLEIDREERLGIRYLQNTLDGKFVKEQVQIPEAIARAIEKNIIGVHVHRNSLRKTAARMFVAMSEEGIHQTVKTEEQVDAHVATIFVQNYGSLHQILLELKTTIEARGEVFSPQKVLDVGYGPGTGMVVLNEIMPDDWQPELKHVYVSGNKHGAEMMKQRAKIILSRQGHENLGKSQNGEASQDKVYAVDTRKIDIRSKLLDRVPVNERYDLIILLHSLLKDVHEFAKNIEDNLEYYLKMLAPGGHVIVLERGNPLGFEIVSRARQISVRPENRSSHEYVKIPRPWIRGSGAKPQNEAGETEKWLDRRYGALDESELELEPEIAAGVEVVESPLDYYLKVLAPYPNDNQCMLLMGRAQYYGYLSKGAELQWLNFSGSVARPKFSVDFKRGGILASEWKDEDALRGEVEAGSGRRNGKSYEKGNFNYLVMERAHVDPDQLGKVVAWNQQLAQLGREIDQAEKGAKAGLLDKMAAVQEKILEANGMDSWPRIIGAPLKRKGHVNLHVLTPQGNIEVWIVPRSLGKDVYHDARKALKGDRWPHGAKTKLQVYGKKKGSQKDKYLEKIQAWEKEEKRDKRKLRRSETKLQRQQDQEMLSQYDGSLEEVLAHE